MQNFADFGSWLRRARGARDLTQEALAEAVGCATQTIRSFEIGRRRPSREMAVRIAVVLDLPIDEREALLRLARVPLATRESDTADPSDSVLPLALAASRPSVEAPTSLIGRQQELQQLGQALLAERQRLVTLLGPGGIGKTQLARQIGVDLMDQFADGTTFVA
jgi:transcriptional regulator with XRE-family HTH domain